MVKPIGAIISNIIYVGLHSFRNKTIIVNMQDEVSRVKEEFDIISVKEKEDY
jgi:hypothetical protein